jgi:hypothetical protein
MSAQDHPKFELFGGYSYNPNIWGGRGPQGWNISAAKNLTNYFSIAADIGGAYSGKTSTYGGTTTTSKGNLHTFMFGPQLTLRRGKYAPFVRVLFGAQRDSLATSSTGGFLPSTSDSHTDTRAVYSPGFGLDIVAKDSWAIRVAQVDGILKGNIRGSVRLSFGVVYRFGVKK